MTVDIVARKWTCSLCVSANRSNEIEGMTINLFLCLDSDAVSAMYRIFEWLAAFHFETGSLCCLP